ncbi:molybdopterin-dependent oxidoreductase [Candidatus Bathyarchaeota archaeon]|nr:molybdopterin-dependent oxidoreductase [Candidatus Bathyarchaeota archaeon]
MSAEDRGKRLPPGQTPIKRLLRWGIDHPGIVSRLPEVDLKNWTLTVDGEVEKRMKLGWEEFLRLPMVVSVSDFHCVEGWSVLGCRWEGVRFREIVNLVQPKESARFVVFECLDGYSTSLALGDLMGDDVVLAYMLDGKPLEPSLGFPVRLVVPDKYAYKSALWVSRITFSAEKALGYWEKRGYSDTADVWKNDRFAR